VQNKKTANIFFSVDVLVLVDNFAPIFAEKILVEAVKNTIVKFTYPIE